jgi:hypothetical protein
MVQEVTLEVIYDDRYSDAPSRWDWPALIDAPEQSDIIVVEGGEPRRLGDARPPLRQRGRHEGQT